MTTIFHIAQATDVEKLAKTGYYEVASLQLEGFIHASRASQVQATGSRYFQGRDDLFLLTIDTTKLANSLRYEEATNQEFFPHIYGTINKEAIVKTEKIKF
jgi:uncharacterized protein (DUF952 family)